MFLGAMIMAPLAAWVMKKVDAIWDGKIKPGFEMLVNNFSAGISAAGLAVVSFYVFGPSSSGSPTLFGNGVNWLIEHSLLPLASIIIEPAKVLFLNNAINHGVLTPLGIKQSVAEGKSILFLLEANPGPGLGLLIAYSIFGTGLAKSTAPAAAIIQFFGGIHEIYFPYVLMKPITLLATIAGGMVGIFTLTIFGAGLRAPAAPGSIIAVFAADTRRQLRRRHAVGDVRRDHVVPHSVGHPEGQQEDRGERRSGRGDREHGGDEGQEELGVRGADRHRGTSEECQDEAHEAAARKKPIHNIVFACDAGMGSSAMGASVLRNKVKKAGFTDITVVNVAIANLTDDIDLIVTHQDLTPRARDKAPSAQHVSVENFMNSPKYDEIVEELKITNAQGSGAQA